ncbi:MAG: hypothetical protein H6Q33_5154, partial [Deltaproteobacteria bacterium]|nr:hypothetical protein [Deltaproteobacteria bacterium]
MRRAVTQLLAVTLTIAASLEAA